MSGKCDRLRRSEGNLVTRPIADRQWELLDELHELAKKYEVVLVHSQRRPEHHYTDAETNYDLQGLGRTIITLSIISD